MGTNIPRAEAEAGGPAWRLGDIRYMNMMMEPTVLGIWMRGYMGPEDTSERHKENVASVGTGDAPADTQRHTKPSP